MEKKLSEEKIVETDLIEDKPTDKIIEEKNTETVEKKTKKQLKKEKKPKNKKRRIIILSVIGIILLLAIIFSTIFALLNINNEKIVSGVKIQGIDVSGLSKEEAKSKLELVFNEKKQKEIELQYQDYNTTINPEVLETNYNIDTAVDEAALIGKNSNIIENNYKILYALLGKENVNLSMTINEEVAKQTIESIETNLPGLVKEPGYYIEGETLIITRGTEGIKIDTENLIEKIKEVLIDINSNIENIEIPVINKTPDDIDIDKIYSEVHTEVQDAYYTKDPFTIHPEVIGVDFNLEEARTMLQEVKEQYEIPLTITQPKVTTAQIGTEAFPDLLGTYSTKYDASDKDRTTNLKLAVQKINDKVVLPGETFSYNKTLGERTIAAGYKNAKVYESGQVVDGIGGGICQISSTLYNSVLFADLEIVERRNHQFVTSYTPAGRDATVVYGQTDFKFKNNRDYAVKIQASISNGIATVSIYGIKTDNDYTISFKHKQVSSIPYTVKYVDDNTLPVGTEKVKQKGANGKIVETYIVKSLNGKVVSTELLSKDTYSAMQRIILRGTKGSTSKTQTQTQTQTTTQTPTQQTQTPSTEQSSSQTPITTETPSSNAEQTQSNE
mgnify:CR=1 FL=1